MSDLTRWCWSIFLWHLAAQSSQFSSYFLFWSPPASFIIPINPLSTQIVERLMAHVCFLWSHYIKLCKCFLHSSTYMNTKIARIGWYHCDWQVKRKHTILPTLGTSFKWENKSTSQKMTNVPLSKGGEFMFPDTYAPINHSRVAFPCIIRMRNAFVICDVQDWPLNLELQCNDVLSWKKK